MLEINQVPIFNYFQITNISINFIHINVQMYYSFILLYSITVILHQTCIITYYLYEKMYCIHTLFDNKS